MEDLQFLDWTDLPPGEMEFIKHILFDVNSTNAVELQQSVNCSPQSLTHHQASYRDADSEKDKGGEQQRVDYVGPPSHVIPHQGYHPHHVPQVVPAPGNVYTLTANVNVQGYLQTPCFPATDDPTPRHTYSPPGAATLIHQPPVTCLPAPYYPIYPQPIYGVYTQPVFPPPPGYTPLPPFAPTADPQPDPEPREESEPASGGEQENDVLQTDYEQDTADLSNTTAPQSDDVEIASVVLEKEEDEIKAEPKMNKLPPAFNSSRNSHRRQVSLPKQMAAEDVPSDSGLPKKSYAQMAQKSDSATGKPFAMIYPTVHHASPKVQSNDVAKSDTIAVEKTSAVFSGNGFNKGPEILQDHDINLQRLGEFLIGYELDHTPEKLQPRGLTNRSNYCYINAILQALITCPPFYNLMKAVPPTQLSGKGAKSRTPIIDSMVKFVNEFSEMTVSAHQLGRKEKAQASKEGGAAAAVTGEVSAGPAFEPAYVYRMLGAMQAAFPVEGRQEDAEEFLSCLLNGLNDEMLEAMKLVKSQSGDYLNGDSEASGEDSAVNRDDASNQDSEWTEVINAKNKSVVTRRAEFGRTPLSAIFQGQMRSRVIRAGTETSTTANVQPFFTLQLDVEKANSVEKALELLVGKDEVFGGTCPKTNKEIPMFTQTSIEELPLILMLHLKCFDYKLHTCSKILKTLEFPIDLKIDGKHLTSKSKSSAKDRQYKLLAVVYHDGKEATKGHYITDVFHVGLGGWVRYDDATVRPVSQQQLLNPRSPRVPYLLYYRRCDTMHPPPNR